MAVKRPTLIPPSVVDESNVMELIEKGGSIPQQSPSAAKSIVPPAPTKKPQSQSVNRNLIGAKRGPKFGTSRASRSTEDDLHRHTLYMPVELYESLVTYQERQRRPWPSLNTLILQAVYDLLENDPG